MKKLVSNLFIASVLVAIVAIPPTGKVTEMVGIIDAISTGPTVSYTQSVWVSALEWCESRGVPTAINKVDRDGTPSYYSFQFKPETFKALGVQYGVLESGLSDKILMEDLKDTNLQRQIVERMIYDGSINWHQQFPVCVQRLGLPPKE